MSVEIGIVMGSDSDLPVMQNAAKFLEKIGVPYELTIVSAHRTPDRLTKYAKTAKERGIKVIIAGAGGAAHLPGMLASNTALPVIGVPIKTSTLSGLDSLYSIVQMPSRHTCCYNGYKWCRKCRHLSSFNLRYRE